ncbi:MAG: diacylglycerol/lipid kinase family protein [Anaerovoracaceae bacterium]
MKNYFFVNPAAGQGRGTEKLVERIEKISKRLGETSFIYHTKDIGDGEIKARETAAALNGEPARFYACGGDGTLNEIINGIIGFSNVSAGCIPTGTGNDMIRNFPGAGDFSDIEAQLRGTLHRIDLIRYAGVISGVFKERYCANMFNIGFDCNVVELAGRLKKKPLISGSVAYLLAVAGMFIRKKGIALKLTEGEEILLDGEVLLCSIANGSYCGGGICSSPQASVDDGWFDINIVKDVPRRTFLRLFPKYQKGTHLQIPQAPAIITVKRSRSAVLEPKERTFFLCADGEIEPAEKVEFRLAPAAMDFILPAS